METAEILNRLKQAVPRSMPEKFPFGRASLDALKVDAGTVAQSLAYLKDEPGIALDWLENLSVFQQPDGALAATYFLRSSKSGRTLVLRASVKPDTPSREASLPSVSSSHAMAVPFEIEIGELFGVRFVDASGKPAHESPQRLPKGWNGFPLRKSYVFPTEFLGIAHSRKNEAGGP